MFGFRLGGGRRMKVEKAREKDGKLELLVELSVAETEEELQNAAMAVVARNGYGADRADYETPLECVRVRMGLVEASFVLDEEIMRRRAPFALSAVRRAVRRRGNAGRGRGGTGRCGVSGCEVTQPCA